MQHKAVSIRAFIGAKDYAVSRNFYKDLGFEEHIISPDMSYFRVNDEIGFYLQEYYVKDWVNNSMLFLEVQDVEQHYETFQQLGLQHKYAGVRFTPIRYEDWGMEYFMHDPSGILWHFGQFNK
ncbi:MAG TPA: VOC family protein [Flavipsychrobacter sp.]